MNRPHSSDPGAQPISSEGAAHAPEVSRTPAWRNLPIGPDEPNHRRHCDRLVVAHSLVRSPLVSSGRA